ncbi:alpha/beta hydrolase-fold protein [Fulvitalea axinellae]
MRQIFSLCVIVLFSITVYGQSGNRYLRCIGTQDSLFSKVLNEGREIYVQLPESFSKNSKRKYPVVFVLDGASLLPTVIDAHAYYSGGFMPEMVLVGISNHKNRTRDLTPSTPENSQGAPRNVESGGASRFLDFIEKELVSYVERNYPVTNYRTLIGHSYGGLFTIYTMTERKDLFKNYLAIDPSLQWDNQKFLKKAKRSLSGRDYKNKSLYMSLAGPLHMANLEITIDNVMDDDTGFTLFPRSNLEFSKKAKSMTQEGFSFEWEFFPNELHGTVAYPSIKNGLVSLFNWFQMENIEKINNPKTPVADLRKVIDQRSAKLKAHFGYSVPAYPEDVLNTLGYMSMDQGMPKKAKMYFERSLAFYPESSNAYDSMSEYYERSGNYALAIEYAIKAYGLSGSKYHKDRLRKLEKALTGNRQ